MASEELGLCALLLAAALAAIMLGGGRERAGAALLVAVSGALLLSPSDPRAGGVWPLLALDLAAVALLGRMAWRAPGTWLIWTLAAEAVAAAASLAFMLQADVDARTYYRAMLAMRYIATLALLIGACRRPGAHL